MMRTFFSTIGLATCAALLLMRVETVDGLHAQERSEASRPTPQQVRSIKANYGSSHDARGRLVFDPYYITLSDEERRDWRQLKHAQQLTHVVLCPVAKYPSYPRGFPAIPPRDLRAEPQTFVRYVSELLDDRLVPIIFLTTGDSGSAADVETYWPGLLSALEREARYVWLVPGFEVVGPGGGWTSAQLSHGLQVIHGQRPESALAVHLQPERASGASHPIEADDPWHGDEPGFWRSNGGEFVDALLYQTPHGTKLLDPNGAGRGVGGWEDRWREILERLGQGHRGWRRVGLSFFEATAFDYHRGNVIDRDVARLSTRAQRLCQQHSVSCTFGNGLPQ